MLKTGYAQIGPTICVSPTGANNPATKPGYNLIFEETFSGSSLDLTKWNRSTPVDDGNGTSNRNIAMNPNIISVSNGICTIPINNTYYVGCPYSAGEIKSFSVSDPNFKPYYFTTNSLVEGRVKIPIKQGMGSSVWL
ncbi:MAG: hypothetical protein H0W62_15000 [Chitinophagales bacterium]|nr:hypothetical protein [Chitinophagales bacterium]